MAGLDNVSSTSNDPLAWTPALYRSDGAWIGRMPDGRLGVGTEIEPRVCIADAELIPMWPFMEQPLQTCLDDFSTCWAELITLEYATPLELLSRTLTSAQQSNSPYWRQLAESWLAQMAAIDSRRSRI
ncbi:hypothetical protein LO763_28290 [Glycomyces sp. A-F 0318]|uniref:hypothetical protein n=1 Tax=Glycomyces amatae TaxID=2881355 RepID=UPI001E345231|nr:hypothetical protein [Glycomyces amatae]MCD0447521.1 hypothetical protein [Glycomyces amatae]